MKPCVKFLVRLSCVLLVHGCCFAQNVELQKNSSRLLANFEQSGDVQALAQLWRENHPSLPGSPTIQASHDVLTQEAVEKKAGFYLRILLAIGSRRMRLNEERRPVAKILEAFADEMRTRTDQPFITPGKTKPETIPDVEYRQRYREYLDAQKTDAGHAETAGTLSSLETSFRADFVSCFESLHEATRRRLLDGVAPETLSTETVKLLTERFNLPFVYQNKKPMLLNAR
ncbi:hypothetical protein [Prosthecobacter sp.]|uniref:hypothetical protein n=1 Tax=Prosthecobacter sp. TaxID=1965333 RepID=UPI003783994E